MVSACKESVDARITISSTGSESTMSNEKQKYLTLYFSEGIPENFTGRDIRILFEKFPKLLKYCEFGPEVGVILEQDDELNEVIKKWVP